MMDRVLQTLEASNYIKIVKKPGVGDLIVILDRSKMDVGSEIDHSKIEQTNNPTA